MSQPCAMPSANRLNLTANASFTNLLHDTKKSIV
jgi:hypothetical protein